MTQETKDKIKYHLHSSAITFLTGFVIFLAPSLQHLDFASLEMAGLSGALLVLARTVLKAAYESIVMIIVSVAARLKK